MDDNQKAYTLALEAAAIDFESAMKGLLEGHRVYLNRIKDELGQSDMALLMALSLTEKGKRLDKDGVMASKIVDRISNINMCKTERRFVAENTKQ